MRIIVIVILVLLWGGLRDVLPKITFISVGLLLIVYTLWYMFVYEPCCINCRKTNEEVGR